MRVGNIVRILVAGALLIAASTAAAQSTKTRVGKFEYDGGYPTKKNVERLNDQLEFQRAVQAYLWALPWVGFAQWQEQHREVFGAEDGALVRYDGYRDKLGALTPDPGGPFLVGFHDLELGGPLLVQVSDAHARGTITDAWQHPLVAFEAGGSYVVAGPGQPLEDPGTHTVVASPTRNIGVWCREVDGEGCETRRWTGGGGGDAIPVVDADGRAWSASPPPGMEYWRLVHRLLEEESIRERDLGLLSLLDAIGLGKETGFDPGMEGAERLEEAVAVGNAMARYLTYAERREGDEAFPDTQWQRPVEPDRDPTKVGLATLDERVAWFFLGPVHDGGGADGERDATTVLVLACRSKSGRWLWGENTYRLRIPADVPATAGWAVTAYDAGTRGFIENEPEIPGVDSSKELEKNEDGSIFVYFGPEPPDDEDKHANWVPTVADRGWFAIFRFHDPTGALRDGSWTLPDIVMTASDDELFGGGG